MRTHRQRYRQQRQAIAADPTVDARGNSKDQPPYDELGRRDDDTSDSTDGSDTDDEWCFVCQDGEYVPVSGCPGCSRESEEADNE